MSKAFLRTPSSLSEARASQLSLQCERKLKSVTLSVRILGDILPLLAFGELFPNTAIKRHTSALWAVLLSSFSCNPSGTEGAASDGKTLGWAIFVAFFKVFYEGAVSPTHTHTHTLYGVTFYLQRLLVTEAKENGIRFLRMGYQQACCLSTTGETFGRC